MTRPVQPGLFQFNVTVPANTPDGEQPITSSAGALSTQSGTLLEVKR